ncbi:UDP-N-acetylmuramoylalanine--D-glutamate ligase [Nonlabens dokdonensis]|jgi:UDP-N-acetylmuramoylalanine--D-glutamate ligase|uniref:UDP-N-acetylmuramoylalanine--D-glutamate ligase n=2 Tax=Nonlabens dokdonensis TaxID=328515 RepID=L7W6V4_NONDD|nr:UDP-N-acetylmuramoyl-L-alanine--D-glutamate ligase [Nonlabens dokdonensis]AGC75927.1 UDP-N-acetylmuramoylalanine--D-glutamate ligase [Nonlabens dokdonensis DSW-6]PZX43606.1 UDP-N-acetylmuramoylalanine--D-glutamate ligase [Nonlabens dokdonensis]
MTVDQQHTDIKKLVVLGGGISGTGAALLGAQKGYDVFLSDGGTLGSAFAKALQEQSIPYESGGHSIEMILTANLIVKSPGIPDHAPMILKVKSEGIEVISEIEFAARFTDEKIIAVTGANGKTTVTSLIDHIFNVANLEHTTGGNIGKSFAQQVYEGKSTYRLLEVSSFQLDGISTFKPHIAILLNITPDHLDRYDYKFENYIASKMRITMNQDENDFLIYNTDDPAITEAIKNANIKAQLIPFSMENELEKGAYLLNNQIHINTHNSLFTMPTEQLPIKGKHNTANAMAASTTAKLLQIRKETIRQSLTSFEGVEHRLENVLKINKVQYINDSKATNVNATYYALDSMEQPTVWIVGGVDKGNNYKDLYSLVNRKVKAIVCLGTDNSKIVEAFGNCVEQMVETSNMEDAVRVAYKLATAGDNVLLSPACASFDLFQNYEDRGRQFKNAVRGL